MEIYTAEENREWARDRGLSMSTQRDNITALEAAWDFLDAALSHNERGDNARVEESIECAKREIWSALHSPSPLANMTPAEAVQVQSRTIREGVNADLLGKVVAERQRRGLR